MVSHPPIISTKCTSESGLFGFESQQAHHINLSNRGHFMSQTNKTKSLKQFLNNIGSSVFLLNTICVGLDRIKQEEITEYKESLRISWSTNDPVNDAQRARIYANKSAITFCVDSLDQYLRSLITSPKIIRDEQIISKLKPGEISMSDRVVALFEKYPPEAKYWVPFVKLLILWRNKIIHSHAKIEIKSNDRKILLENREVIMKEHSGLDVQQTLDRFSENMGPTLKDTSTMIAILIKSIRYIDQEIVENEITKEYLLEVVAYQLGSGHKEAAKSEIKTIWNMQSDARERKISNIIKHNGIILASGNQNNALITEIVQMYVDDVLEII